MIVEDHRKVSAQDLQVRFPKCADAVKPADEDQRGTLAVDLVVEFLAIG
jgi:hypothetical protein